MILIEHNIGVHEVVHHKKDCITISSHRPSVDVADNCCFVAFFYSKFYGKLTGVRVT